MNTNHKIVLLEMIRHYNSLRGEMYRMESIIQATVDCIEVSAGTDTGIANSLKALDDDDTEFISKLSKILEEV